MKASLDFLTSGGVGAVGGCSFGHTTASGGACAVRGLGGSSDIMPDICHMYRLTPENSSLIKWSGRTGFWR